MRTVKLWQGCALIVGLDPDTFKGTPDSWMAGPGSGTVFERRCFPTPDVKAKFKNALRLAETAVSYQSGPIVPQGQPYRGMKTHTSEVLLSEMVACFVSCGWPADIPPNLLGVIPGPVASEPVNSASNTNSEPKRWTLAKLAELRAYRDKHTMAETADYFGISQQRIRQVQPREKPKPKHFAGLIHRSK